MNAKRLVIWLTLVTVALGGLALPARAQREGVYGVQAATPLGDTRYVMSSSVDKEAPAQYTYFRFYTDDYEVTSIEVHVEFDDSKLNFAGVDTTFFDWPSEATFTVTSGTGYVFVQVHDIPATAFDYADTLLKFTWGTECFTDGTSAALSMDTTATGGRNCLFVSGGNTYFPTHTTNGSVGIYEYTADVYGTDDTRPAGHTAIIPLSVTNNFDPNAGFFVRVFYNQAKLQFTGWDTAGAYVPQCGSGESVVVDTSANGDTIYIASTCQYSKVAPPAEFLVRLHFKNNMTTDEDSGYVVVDSMKMTDCANAYAVDTANDTAWVITPRYTASIKYKRQQIQKGYTADIEIQMKNTFEVDMDESEGSKRAAFRTKNSAWNLISYDSIYSEFYTSGDSTLRWTNTNSSGDRIYKSRYSESPHNIPPRATFNTIMTQRVTAGSTTGEQHVKFTRDAWGGDEYGLDSKLHSTGIEVTIHSIDDATYDSLFTLELDSIRVYQSGGGGGSCPFVYTWDGADFKLEDAILTACEKLPEGTPVVDYLPLTFQPALENGSYRMRIHEEEAEKTFLDDAELLIIDHLPGYQASVTTEGDMVFGNGSVHPWTVTDDAGNDITRLLSARDEQRFEAHGAGSLIATFNRREGEFYALGANDSIEGIKGPCEVSRGPLEQTNPEPTIVRIEVQDARRIWHELPGGPARLPKTRIRPVIDLAGYDLPQMFQIRYSWEGDFSLDEIALSVEVPVEHTLTAASVEGLRHSGDHPTALFARQTDGKYAELVTGEYLDLEFPAVPVPEGMERTLVLKTTGYFLQWFGDRNAGRPLAFGLNGNYPNPFNPTTTIRYSLASDAVVTLEIFNVLGQKVRTLIPGTAQPAGNFEAIWDGRDDQGVAVGSGTYLYKLRAGDFVESRKMILLK